MPRKRNKTRQRGTESKRTWENLPVNRIFISLFALGETNDGYLSENLRVRFECRAADQWAQNRQTQPHIGTILQDCHGNTQGRPMKQSIIEHVAGLPAGSHSFNCLIFSSSLRSDVLSLPSGILINYSFRAAFTQTCCLTGTFACGGSFNIKACCLTVVWGWGRRPSMAFILLYFT